MRGRLLLWTSLALNLLLAGMIVLLRKDSEALRNAASPVNPGANFVATVKTNLVIRRQYFDWSQVESRDFPTYIRNLRGIGCPERTIRDIIVAEVNEIYAERISREIVLPEQQWWLPDPSMDVLQSAGDQIAALEKEKQRVLTELLGPGWNDGPGVSVRDPIRFDGPVLSRVSPETRADVYRIEAAAQKARDAYLNQMQQAGIQPDPAELARLRQSTRAQLAALLTPEQMEEYLLRYSRTAETLRQQLRGFGANPDEFRRIFRTRDAYDEQLALLTGNDASTRRRRAELENMRDAALRQSLGAERYELYKLTENPLFQEAQSHVVETGAAPEKVLPIMQVKQVAREEIERVQNDASLSDEERMLALRKIEEQQEASIERIINGQRATP